MDLGRYILQNKGDENPGPGSHIQNPFARSKAACFYGGFQSLRHPFREGSFKEIHLVVEVLFLQFVYLFDLFWCEAISHGEFQWSRSVPSGLSDVFDSVASERGQKIRIPH